MKIICFGFIYIFEQFISFLYFKGKYEMKRDIRIVFSCYFASFIIQYLVNLIDIPYLNLFSFLICNLIIALFCFSGTFKKIAFNVVLLEGIMITTEIVVMYSFSSLLGIDLFEYKNDDLIVFLETAATKTLYFIVAYLISKSSSKNSIDSKEINNYSLLLFLIPVSSILVISSYAYLSFNYEINRTTNILFTCSSLIMLISNVLIFIIHEKIISTLTKNAQLELEKQKTEINKEYYLELERQYNSSNILIHDIKKCLSNIRELSNSKDNKEIVNYIDSIYKGYEIKSLRKYSENKLINVIISRYYQLCCENGIEFSADVRNIDFSFISDSDITALLDNLLENAFEAAKNSTGKKIDLTIENRNEKYVLFSVLNSSDEEPKKIGNHFISSKENKDLHGIGLKSVYRVVKKYSGNVDYSHDKINKLFHISVLVKTV